jgi:hypothetical protein
MVIISKQESQFGYILEGLGMENVGIHILDYLTAIWYILWPFGIFLRFGMLYQEKPNIKSKLNARIQKLF